MAEVDRQSDLDRIAAEEQKIRDLAKAASDREKLMKAMEARHRIQESQQR